MAVAIVVAVGLGATVLPALAGVPWAAIGAALTSVSATGLVAAIAVWLAGLAVHTVTLKAALPSLTHRRALTLNLTGSAVANVLPLGGAAGIAINRTMMRRWGVPDSSFAAFTIVSNIWDVLGKLTLAAIALPLLAFTGLLASQHLLGLASVAAGVATVALALLLAVLASERATELIGTVAETTIHALLKRLHSERRPRVRDHLCELRHQCRMRVRHGWPLLSAGMAGYLGLLFVLLWLCLQLTGAAPSLAVVLLALTVERLLTLPGLTPGGIGVVDVGMVAVLVAAGGTPVASVAGALLYRALTFGLEIPVGGSHLAVWWWLQRRRELKAIV